MESKNSWENLYKKEEFSTVQYRKSENEEEKTMISSRRRNISNLSKVNFLIYR